MSLRKRELTAPLTLCSCYNEAVSVPCLCLYVAFPRHTHLYGIGFVGLSQMSSFSNTSENSVFLGNG